MTQDEIIHMAREAGAEPMPFSNVLALVGADIERFAALVAAHEREACIEKCKPYGLTGECVAIAIRNRGGV